MVKIVGPMFGLDARGALGSSVVYSIRKGVNYARNYTTGQNPQTSAQNANRGAFTDGVSRWKFGQITTPVKALWNYYATGTTESGFNRFMRFYLGDNYDPITKTKVSPSVIPNPQ